MGKVTLISRDTPALVTVLLHSHLWSRDTLAQVLGPCHFLSLISVSHTIAEGGCVNFNEKSWQLSPLHWMRKKKREINKFREGRECGFIWSCKKGRMRENSIHCFLIWLMIKVNFTVTLGWTLGHLKKKYCPKLSMNWGRRTHHSENQSLQEKLAVCVRCAHTPVKISSEWIVTEAWVDPYLTITASVDAAIDMHVIIFDWTVTVPLVWMGP